MSNQVAQLAFAADVALSLVALTALGIVLPGVRVVLVERSTRLSAGSGFALIGLSSALSAIGAVASDSFGAIALAIAGAAVLMASAGGWNDRPASQGIRIGSLLVIVAALSHAADLSTSGWLVRLVAAGLLGVAVVSTTRLSIPGRITGGASLLLLAVVLSVSVVLSNVLTDNVTDDALGRLDARARTEATVVERAAADAVRSANIVAGSLAGASSVDLVALAASGDRQASAQLGRELATLGDLLFTRGPLAYLIPDGTVVAIVGDLSGDAVIDLAGSRVVFDALDKGLSQSIVLLGQHAYAAGARQVTVGTADGPAVVGLVVATDVLDSGFLDIRRDEGTLESFALVAASGVLGRADASDGSGAASSSLAEVGRRALADAAVATRVGSDHLVAAAPVRSSADLPVLAVASSLPIEGVEETRDDLLGNLALVSLLVAAFGVALAARVGAAIGQRVSALAWAARRMEEGNLGTRAEQDAPDELGVLASTFNAMAVSIETMTDDLRRSAMLEARLRGRMEAVIDGMGEGLVGVDGKGRITELNQAAERLLHVRARAVKNTDATEVVEVLDDAGLDVTGRLLSTAKRTTVEGVIVVADEEIPVVVEAGPVRGVFGERAGTTLVIRDVRREREVERMKTEFLSNTGHELRTPLTTIKGWAAVLNKYVGQGREIEPMLLREALGTISDGSADLERRIDQLVRFAELNAGRMQLRTESVPVRQVLNAARDRWDPKCGSTHELRVRVARGVRNLEVDRARVDTCLDELLDNAVKFSPDGGVIALEAELDRSESEPRVAVSVVDHGIGIAGERLDEVTREFGQADGSATRRFGGLGIGIPTVDRIARAHGGSLRFESVEKKGSRFTIVLPIPTSDLERVRSAQGRSDSGGRPRRVARRRARDRGATSRT